MSVSKTLIVGFVVSPMQLWHTVSSQLDILRMDILCLKKCQHDFFPPTESMHLNDTYIDDKLLACALLYLSRDHRKLGKSNRVCEPALVFLVLGILSRNYKTRKLLLLPFMCSQLYVQLYIEVNSYITSKASNILYVECKQNNGMMEWNNTPSTVAIMVMFRGGSRTAATSKMERFVIIFSQSTPSWMLQQSYIRL